MTNEELLKGAEEAIKDARLKRWGIEPQQVQLEFLNSIAKSLLVIAKILEDRKEKK